MTQGYLIKAFGQLPIRELTPGYIRKWITQRQLTSKTIRNILIPLRAVIEDAVDDDIILRNPLDRVVLGKLVDKKTAKSDYVVDPLDVNEMHAILAHAEPPIRHLVQFNFFTGLRSSEWMALKWQDIDWIHGTAHISRAWVEKQEKSTKTVSGIRTIVLLPPALDALHAQKAHTFLQNKHVFHNPRTDRPWQTNSQFRFQWQSILKRAGVRYRNPYQTRHTYASMLLSAGENMLWVAKQMGHRDTEMVIKTYGKWIPDTGSKVGYQTVKDWGKAFSGMQFG